MLIDRWHRRFARGFAGWLAAGLLVLPLPGQAFEFSLRPAVDAEANYIHVEAAAPTADFVKLIAVAVQKADTVQAAAARWKAELAGVDSATGAMLPKGSFFGEVGVAGGSSPQPYSYGVRVSVPIYDGFSGSYALQAQRASSEAAYYSAVDELAATLVDLVAAAAAIRRSEQIVAIRRWQIDAAQALIAQIKGEQQGGVTSSVDVQELEAQAAQLRIAALQSDADLMDARTSFATIAGSAPGRIGDIGSIAQYLPRSAEGGIDMALRQNPSISKQSGLALAADLTTRSLAGQFGPQLTLDLSAGMTGDLYGAVPATNDASAMLRLEVPLEFGTEATVRRSALNANAAELEANAALTGVVAGVESAFDRLVTTRRMLKLARTAVERSSALLTGMEVERQVGQRSTSDVFSAQQTLAQARISVATMQYEMVVAEHLLAAQIGEIATIYGVAIR